MLCVSCVSVNSKLKLDADFRPDGWYGLSKVWGEAMARMYWDKHGIEGISIRIGTSMGRPPENFRMLSTWLSGDDLTQLIMQCITVPDIGYMAVWACSNNDRAYWDNTGAGKLGFEPKDNAEDHRETLRAQGVDVDSPDRGDWEWPEHGGSFVRMPERPVR